MNILYVRYCALRFFGKKQDQRFLILKESRPGWLVSKGVIIP